MSSGPGDQESRNEVTFDRVTCKHERVHNVSAVVRGGGGGMSSADTDDKLAIIRIHRNTQVA